MTKPQGFVHTRIGGKLRAVWDDGTITLPIIRGGDGGEENNPAEDPPKTFSQADVDRIVQDRLARVKPSEPDDYADLQAKAKKLDELETAQLDDVAKANKERDDALAEIASLKAENTKYAEGEKLRTARDQIVAAAKDKAIDAGVVADLLLAKNAVAIDDAGQVTNADTAVKQLLESTPTLAKSEQGKPSFGAGAGRGTAGGSDKGSASAGRDRWKQRHGKS